MKLYKTIVLCAAALCAAAPAFAQEVWIGRPTIGDVIRHQFGQAVQAQQKAVRSKAQFNDDIARARKDFFATASKPEARAEAEKRFANLLLGKDYVFLAGLLAEGTGKASRTRNDAMHAITGGPLDGGVAPPARRAFDHWVDAVRTSLGARNPDELLFVTNSDKVLAAIRDNVDSYEAYKLLRDKFEIDRFSTGKAIGQARAADGGFRLHEQQQGALDTMRDLRWDRLGHNQPLRARLIALKQAGQPVLSCEYGPTDSMSNGRPVHERYAFWFKQAPDGIDELMSMDTSNGLAGLRTRTALTRCPDTSALAKQASGAIARSGAPAAALTPPAAGSGGGAAAQPSAPLARPATAEPRAEAPAARTAAQLEQERMAAVAAEQDARRAAAASQLEAQRATVATRQQVQRAAAEERQCAASEAQLERGRAQLQALPPQHAARYQGRLQALEQSHAQRCGG